MRKKKIFFLVSHFLYFSFPYFVANLRRKIKKELREHKKIVILLLTSFLILESKKEIFCLTHCYFLFFFKKNKQTNKQKLLHVKFLFHFIFFCFFFPCTSALNKKKCVVFAFTYL